MDNKQNCDVSGFRELQQRLVKRYRIPAQSLPRYTGNLSALKQALEPHKNDVEVQQWLQAANH